MISHEEIKDRVVQFKKENGNKYIPTHDLIVYMAHDIRELRHDMKSYTPMKISIGMFSICMTTIGILAAILGKMIGVW